MVTLLVKDLLENLRAWVGTFGVLVVAGGVAGIPATMIETALHVRGTVGLGLIAVASTVIVLSAVSLSVVLSTTVRTLVEVRRRAFALWLIVGLQPRQVFTIVLVELTVVAVIGAGTGALIAVAACPPLVGALLAQSSGLGTVSPSLSLGSALGSAAFAALVAVLAGLPLAQRAGVTPPLALLRGGPQRSSRVIARAIVGALLVSLVVSMGAGLAEALPNGAAQAVLMGPILIAVCAVLAPLYLPALIRAWTSVLPARMSVSWFLAREAVIDSAQRSSASVVAFTVAIGLPWTFICGQRTVVTATVAPEGADAVSPLSLALLLSGPTLLAAIGGAASVFMASADREREDALLRVAGAGSAVRGFTAVWEAVIHVVSALIVSAVVSLVIAGGVSLALSPVAPTVVPVLAPSVGLLGAAGCVVLALAASFASRLGRRSIGVSALMAV
ncbi:hypothetical protein DVJ78_08315 [Humibacter sp. BT305]|nr:hypothetical protein DVJ78_08315 [Humibacter sp. BT305]